MKQPTDKQLLNFMQRVQPEFRYYNSGPVRVRACADGVPGGVATGEGRTVRRALVDLLEQVARRAGIENRKETR